MKVYAVCYNSNTMMSFDSVLSIHRSKEEAEQELSKSKENVIKIYGKLKPFQRFSITDYELKD